MRTAERRSRRGRRAGSGLLALGLALSTTLGACIDTESLLDVDIPGRVETDALDNPVLATTLTNSVIGDVECSWNNYVAAASHHSDEWIQSSGNSTMKRWGLRDIDENFEAYASAGCGANYGIFTTLHTARFQGETNFNRLKGFADSAVPNKTALMARIRAYGALPYIAFAEGFCGTPLKSLDGQLNPAGTKVYTSKDLFAIAEQRFTEALQLADQANLADFRNFALVGRARARLGQENYAGAIEDAARVPAGFRFAASRDATTGRRQNALFRAISGGPTAPSGQKHASVAPSYRNVEYKGVKDPRVNVTWDGRSLGFDFSTPHYTHNKATAFETPVTMASYQEAQMIIAEAATLAGDLARARQILNNFHAAAGLPAITEADTPNRDALLRQVIEERRREFFSEGGHRLRDHLKWRGTAFNVPFLGEAGSDHPNGVDQNGQPYGKTTCFPVPTIEVTGT